MSCAAMHDPRTLFLPDDREVEPAPPRVLGWLEVPGHPLSKAVRMNEGLRR